MTFLNAILLGGLAAASLPVLIHLFNKNRFRVVRWGAMHLINTAFEKNQRRLNLDHLLLLLVRCAIPAVLALCMARPVLTGAARLLGADKASLVVLLDNSYSMDSGAGASANFNTARDTATKIIEGAGRGSDFSVLLMAGGARPLLDGAGFDVPRLVKELGTLHAGYGKAQVGESLEAAAAQVGRMQQPNREIVVLTDFQRVSWSDEQAAARARAVEQLKALPLPPQVTLLHVGAPGRDNVAVESLDFSRLVLGIGQTLNVRANVRNFGERDYPELRVYFRVDGRERSAAQIQLAAGEQRQVLFTTAFDTAGSHVVEVHADADALKADNSLSASIPVWNEVPVLLVNGDPSPEPLKGETDFLEVALQPFGQAKAGLTDLIKTRVIPTAELGAASLAQRRVAVLANVRQISDVQLAALRDFVKDGGGLLIFPGNRANTDWHNLVFAGRQGAEELLPLQLASLGGSPDDHAPRARIVAEHYSHPALELFNDPRNGSLADAQIKLWYKLRLPREPDPNLTVIANLSSGDPFLVERRVGEGRVMLCTTACDADWGDLPVKPFYLPLMQRLVTYLASTVFPPRNVEVGKPLAAFFPKAEAGRVAVFTDPSGLRHEVALTAKGSRATAEFTEARQPGLYVMNGPDGSTVHFVANTSREESDLRPLSPAEREAIAKAMGATVVNSLKEYQDRDHGRRFGREIWKPLLWVVLALLLGELALQQWFAGRR
ncbi:MAG: VWA domain-containing protein [Verrucomicrobia bacterium]|nr:VWA domain-containing protein [Verrucomicrobiota bacterium]